MGLTNNLSPEELACVEQIKSSPEKERFFDGQKCKITSGVKAALLSLGIAIGSTGIANAKETTNYSQFEQFGITQTVPTQEIPADLRQGVILVQEEFNRLKNEGKISDLLMSVELVGSSASEIASDLSLAPKQTLEDLGIKGIPYFVAYQSGNQWSVDPRKLNEKVKVLPGFKLEVLNNLVNTLFDTSDAEIWLRSGFEKREYTTEELQEYKEDAEKTEQRWLNKINISIKLMQEGKDTPENLYKHGAFSLKGLLEGQELFIKGVESLSIEPSKEALKRLLILSMTLAYYNNSEIVKSKLDIGQLQLLLANIGEYMQLTNKDFKMVKLGFGNPDGFVLSKYGVPSGNDIKSSKILGEYDFYSEVSDKTLKLFTVGNNLLNTLQSDIYTFNIKMNEIEGKRLDEEGKRLDEENEISYTVKKLGDEADIVYSRLNNNINKLTTSKDESVIPIIKKDIKRLNEIYNELSKLNTENVNFKTTISQIQFLVNDMNDKYKKLKVS